MIFHPKNLVAWIARRLWTWVPGAIIWFRNHSRGLRLERDGDLFAFELDGSNEVHAIMRRVAGLPRRGVIRLRFRIEEADGLYATDRPAHKMDPDGPYHRFDPQVSIMFQQRGDNWRSSFYRWYSPNHTVIRMVNGIYGMEVDLTDPEWRPVYGQAELSGVKPKEFAEAKLRANNVNICFGWRGGRSHGVAGHCRFTLLEFHIL